MYAHLLKPLFDFLLAFVLLLLFSPLILVVSAMVFISMGSPVLFKQERPGKDENIFTIYKFRTMNNSVNAKGEPLEDKQRLTFIGKFLRSMSLDELPQLFNILKGEMSFIGPRPLLKEYLPLYNDEQKKRHRVKPGISGLAQVNGRNNISWKEKLDYDISYTKEISFLVDMKILIKTIQKVLMRQDISSQEHVTSEKFNGHN